VLVDRGAHGVVDEPQPRRLGEVSRRPDRRGPCERRAPPTCVDHGEPCGPEPGIDTEHTPLEHVFSLGAEGDPGKHAARIPLTKKAGPVGPAFPIRGEVVFRLPGRFVDRHGAPFPTACSIGSRGHVRASVLRLKSRTAAVSAGVPEDVHRGPAGDGPFGPLRAPVGQPTSARTSSGMSKLA